MFKLKLACLVSSLVVATAVGQAWRVSPPSAAPLVVGTVPAGAELGLRVKVPTGIHPIVFYNQVKGNNGQTQCLAVRNGSITYSSPLMIWNCIPNDPAQNFTFSNNQLHVGPANSPWCVAVFGSVQRGSPVGVWQCKAGDPNQAFSYGMNLDITSTSARNICLGVRDGSNAPGAPVILWDCSETGRDNQAWGTTPPGGSAPPPPTPVPVAAPVTLDVRGVNLISRLGAKCLGVENDSQQPGARIIEWDCINQSDQLFVFNAAGEIRTFNGSNLCVDDKGGMLREMDQIVSWPCNGGPGQHWRFSNGEIRNAANSNLCIDLRGGLYFGNTDAILFRCNGQNNQHFVAGVTVPKGSAYASINPGTQGIITPKIPQPTIFIGHNGSAIVAQGGGNVIVPVADGAVVR